MRPRVDASPTNAPPYAQILPRPPAQTPQATPQTPARGAQVQQYQVPQYHSHGYPAQSRHDSQAFNLRQPNAGQLHPATRPQYGAPQHQHGDQLNHHIWQAVPQATSHTSSQQAHTPMQGKPQFTKQSHSPIPLPPYVRQMTTASPVGPKQPGPGRTAEQGGSHVPSKDSSTAPPASTRPLTGARATPAPASNVHPQQQNPPQQGQWAPPGSGQINSIANPQWAPQGAMPTPSPTSQHSQNGPGWAPSPQPQSHPLSQGAGISPTGAGTEDNSALVEKMMMNLRRASQNFGKVEQGRSLAEQPGQAQGQAQSQAESQP